MRKDHRPAWLKHLQLFLNRWFITRFIAPQLDQLGRNPHIVGPRHLVLFGAGISIGDFLHMACDSDRKVRIIAWPKRSGPSSIKIGDYCLIAPGVKIQCAEEILIGDNCMFGADASISDSDWHGVYNRLRPFGRATRSVNIKNNVWIGERAIITKGVTIGENSIIGAGAVVTKDIPPNRIAAGNPAKVIKEINPNKKMLTREIMFSDPEKFEKISRELDHLTLADNSILTWLRHLVVPNKTS